MCVWDFPSPGITRVHEGDSGLHLPVQLAHCAGVHPSQNHQLLLQVNMHKTHSASSLCAHGDEILQDWVWNNLKSVTKVGLFFPFFLLQWNKGGREVYF